MITKDKFISIKLEVEDAVDELFKKTISNNFNNYFLLLNNCIIKNGELIFDSDDSLSDENRLSFLETFLNQNYSFAKNVNTTEDNEDRFFLELMIYTHIWESKYFINRLAQIANLSIKEKYNLDIQKDHPYHNNRLNKKIELNDYIRNKIKEKFNQSKLKIGLMFPKSYHSQIRNAFAHSDFYFSKSKKEIILNNYNENKKHTVKSISFDDWTIRFCYTFLFSYTLECKMKTDYSLFVKENGTFEIEISDIIYVSKFNQIENRFLFIEKSKLN